MDTSGPTDVAVVLDHKHRELGAAIAEISAPPVDSGGISFGKRVGEGTSMAVDRLSSVAAHERLLAMNAHVERALAKLDEGTYGVCDVCRRAIPSGRLEALPWATVCLACAGSGRRSGR